MWLRKPEKKLRSKTFTIIRKQMYNINDDKFASYFQFFPASFNLHKKFHKDWLSN